ncbi:MAG: class I SAM-dependent methyltransferase [Bdellovibrionales bacterium]
MTSEAKPHSAEYFGETRDFWWNRDFLELMGQRLSLSLAKNVLDVGCGVGHWGRVWEAVLSKEARVTGVDREESWVTKATELAKASGLGDRYQYQKGDANALPFADNVFDLVTCQTVLIHLKDPKVGLREMLRVLKPGGTLLVAEPNNFSNRTMMNSLTPQLSIDEILDRLRFDLLIERGKQALGLGFNSIGDFIPGYLAEVGGKNIRVYLSDKASPSIPPYSSREQQVNIQQMREWAERKFIGWDREEVLGYFLAGGGLREDFDRYFNLFVEDFAKTLKAIDDGGYHCAGGAVTYLIGATK